MYPKIHVFTTKKILNTCIFIGLRETHSNYIEMVFTQLDIDFISDGGDQGFNSDCSVQSGTGTDIASDTDTVINALAMYTV